MRRCLLAPKSCLFASKGRLSAANNCQFGPNERVLPLKDCHIAAKMVCMPSKATFSNRSTRPLVVKAQLGLGMTHRKFGEALGASERTSLRWTSGASFVPLPSLVMLARLVYPVDAPLAAEIAAAASETLESLGIVTPPTPPPAPNAKLALHLVGDLVVCAAAEAIAVAPSIARTALVAAFVRAEAMGLTVGEVVSALEASAARA